MASNECTGWLLDLYPDERTGDLTLWMLCNDGRRARLRQAFPVTFYAAGPNERLRELWRWLQAHPAGVRLARTERRDLFAARPLTVLAAEVPQAARQPHLFREVERRFPDLVYYDADIHPLARWAARFDVFPLTRFQARVGPESGIETVIPLEARWALDPTLAPLRILSLEPDSDPGHSPPAHLLLRYDRFENRLPLEPARPLLADLAAVLRRFDPDLILSQWGDAWLIPRLLELADREGFPLPWNRDSGIPVQHRDERSYHAYGQVVYRAQQSLLYGRWHIDRRNSMMLAECAAGDSHGTNGLEGVLELARVSGLPVQTAARNSPGAGITAMQTITALQEGILVPYQKGQTEFEKSTLELIRADRGGLIFQPLVGLHRDVAEIDFISMYPSILHTFNISPETVSSPVAAVLGPTAATGEDTILVPELDLLVRQSPPGLLPATLAPLLEKRTALKERLSAMDQRDCRFRTVKARSTALKWLLVVCFGYTGYKNARFGRIEAHQAITAYAREIVLRAKEAAESLGFTVLHLYVDGLWVQRSGAQHPADFQPLLDKIARRTRLSIALDGIYRWIAFLPSRQDPGEPVPNRYFGVFQNGEIKARGIELRRGDACAFVAGAQDEILECLARAPCADELPDRLPEAVQLVRRRLATLRGGAVPLESLVVRQRLSRALEEYRSPSPAARAAAQLQLSGRALPHPGQKVRFVYTRGEPGVWAWDLLEPPDPRMVDTERYARLLLRAAAAVLEPLGFGEAELCDWVLGNAWPLLLPKPARG